MLVCVCLVQLNSKMLKGVKIVGICTQQLHTVLYSKDTVYTFGQNAGQLGNSDDFFFLITLLCFVGKLFYKMSLAVHSQQD